MKESDKSKDRAMRYAHSCGMMIIMSVFIDYMGWPFWSVAVYFGVASFVEVLIYAFRLKLELKP